MVVANGCRGPRSWRDEREVSGFLPWKYSSHGVIFVLLYSALSVSPWADIKTQPLEPLHVRKEYEAMTDMTDMRAKSRYNVTTHGSKQASMGN